jgi:tRNA-dihydrouridine synthase B
MNIGKLQITNPLLLAPMAGYSDSPFRQLCKESGADIVYTEFVSSEGIIRGSEKTYEYLTYKTVEKPIGIQIFGHNPASMAAAAQYIEGNYQPDIIDLNFGCSVRKVIKKNAGAALLKDLDLLESIAASVVKAVKTPVTAKIRAGWNHQSIVALDVAKRLENAGIEALTIHPRTASDGYRNRANWDIIAEVKQSLKIPVIGNGDIKKPEDVIRMFDVTGCDAVMIGRGAIANPWIFSQSKDLLKGVPSYATPSVSDQLQMCLRHIQMERKFYDDEHTNRIMKKFYRWYIREFSNASELRNQLMQSPTLTDTIRIIEEVITALATSNET